jgi:hypothetical protein
MLVHACNPSTQEAEAENYEFKASLSYIVKPCINKREKGREERRKEGR